MRQVSIRKLRANLSTELSNLPFVITKKGRVIAEVCVHNEEEFESCVHKEAEKGVHNEEKESKKPELCVHNEKEAKGQLAGIMEKKTSVHNSESTFSTGETLGYSKADQLNKSRKKK